MTGIRITLDAKGRCCGRKPMVYRRTGHLFCPRCCAQFSLGGEQQANWAWHALPDGTFRAALMKHDANKDARLKEAAVRSGVAA